MSDGTSRQQNVIRSYKEMSVPVMRRRGGTLNAYDKGKEVGLKRLRSVRSQLHDIMDEAKL